MTTHEQSNPMSPVETQLYSLIRALAADKTYIANLSRTYAVAGGIAFASPIGISIASGKPETCVPAGVITILGMYGLGMNRSLSELHNDLSHLEEHLDFPGRVPEIEGVITYTAYNAKPESEVLAKRLHFVQTRREMVVREAIQNSRNPERERQKGWKHMKTNIEDLDRSITLLTQDVTIAIEFSESFSMPDYRAKKLQTFAARMLDASKLSRDKTPKGMESAAKVLWRVKDGLARANDVTVFDMKMAYEQIRQNDMNITHYTSASIV